MGGADKGVDIHAEEADAAEARVQWNLVPADWVPLLTELLAETKDLPRLSGVDCFAGSKGISKAFLAKNLECLTFDIAHCKMQNILQRAGLRFLLSMIVRVVKHGLCFFGPPCKFWIFLTLSHTQRTAANPVGSSSSWMAREGNAIANELAKILRVCAALSIFTVVEHPAGSFLGKYPPMMAALVDVKATEVTLKMHAFGHLCMKPTRLWGTAPWLPAFGEHAQRLLALAPQRAAQRLAKVVGSAVNGCGAELTESAAYPEKFCACVVKFHLDWLQRHQAAWPALPAPKRARSADEAAGRVARLRSAS